jgi:hypothetical protein
VRPPDPPDAAWIGPPGLAPPRQKKKKAALTPKEALRAKVQARAAKHPAPAKQAERENARDHAEAPSDEVDSDRAEAQAETTKAAAKPTLLQRLLGMFRKPKPPADE